MEISCNFKENSVLFTINYGAVYLSAPIPYEDRCAKTTIKKNLPNVELSE